MQYLILLAALPFLAAADHGPPGYGYAPKLYCRETNTSVYAEVGFQIICKQRCTKVA